ncbi:hypothetical protein FA95DRAFT_108463 [Auriscalpium vulgare]|uniref:Uncharacterized protein n=1 Tax=Auriscalpium vulgare TaxID=40419 RepID=A0ACB8S7R9_9AGAM|nr:hypothetical protein FA95DRAFT_108463 [Auriscalpium vulgare]
MMAGACPVRWRENKVSAPPWRPRSVPLITAQLSTAWGTRRFVGRNWAYKRSGPRYRELQYLCSDALAAGGRRQISRLPAPPQPTTPYAMDCFPGSGFETSPPDCYQVGQSLYLNPVAPKSESFDLPQSHRPAELKLIILSLSAPGSGTCPTFVVRSSTDRHSYYHLEVYDPELERGGVYQLLLEGQGQLDSWKISDATKADRQAPRSSIWGYLFDESDVSIPAFLSGPFDHPTSS